MSLYLKLGLKLLFRKRKEAFLSVNAFLSLGGVFLSVLVLIVVVAVMTGFGNMFKETLMGMNPHIVLSQRHALEEYNETVSTLKKVPGITAVRPFVHGYSVLRAKDIINPISMRGIAMGKKAELLRLNKFITEGKDTVNSGEIILGKELAKKLHLHLGDQVDIFAAGGFDDDEFPDELPFNIVGIFESGMYEFDLTQVFIPLKEAQSLYGFTKEVHGIGVCVEEPEKVALIKEKVMEVLNQPLWVATWLEKNRPLFMALKAEKNMMFILLTFAVLIASFNILSTQVMLVMEKTKDIGILKAIGFSPIQILWVFLLQGSFIGLLGTLLGLWGGVTFVHHINPISDWVEKHFGWEVFPEKAYLFKDIPYELLPQDLTFICLLAATVSILASLYPAIRASLLPAAVSLRYE